MNLDTPEGIARLLVGLEYPDEEVEVALRRTTDATDQEIKAAIAAAKQHKADTDRQNRADLDREAVRAEHKE